MFTNRLANETSPYLRQHKHNLGTLLRYVHMRGPTSRAELTASLGLNRSTIGALTADLAGVGLVTEELPRDHSRAGRPSLVVRPEPERFWIGARSRVREASGRRRRSSRRWPSSSGIPRRGCQREPAAWARARP